MTPTTTPRRGEVWRVNFDPSFGAEQQKLRPAVVVSEDAVGRLPLRIVVPITAWKDHYDEQPWMVWLPSDSTNGLSKESAADAFQMKSVCMTRFKKRLGFLTASQLEEVVAAIALCVGAS